MKLLLRNWHAYTKFPTHQVLFTPETQVDNEFPPQLLEMDTEDRLRYDEEQKAYAIHAENDDMEYGFESEQSNTEDIEDLGHELQWPTAAPYIMLEGYQYLEPINRAQLARDKLHTYQRSLGLSFAKHFEPRLNGEDYVRKRQAELFMHRMNPLTPTFLKQGINFLNANVFAKLMESGKIAILKELLSGGAFEDVTFVHQFFLIDYIPHFIDNPRNEFLLNILCYECSLLPGQDAPIFEKEEEQQESDRESEDDSIMKEVVFGGALGRIIKNHSQLNRLRLFWSFQKLYLPEEDHFDYIFEELNHVTFQVSRALQAEITREAKFIFNSAYSPGPFEEFIAGLLFQFKTFHEFMTAYALCIIALSKLRAIKRLLPENKSNELHPVFQMIEFNLPKKEIPEVILLLLEMLSHQDHSRIEYENFKRSYNYWLKDYTQPLKTLYHSPLSRLLETDELPLNILYQRNPSAPAYTKFSHTLKRNKQTPSIKNYFGQSDMVKSILKKDYQPVLDHFVTTFEFAVNKDLGTKFNKEVKKADKTLTFKNSNEAALYKLKAAHNIFFTQTLPQPLSPQNMQPTKFSYDALTAVSKDPIDIDEHTEQFKAHRNFEDLVSILQNRPEIVPEEVADGEFNAEEKEVESLADVVDSAEPIAEEAAEEVVEEGEEIAEEDLQDELAASGQGEAASQPNLLTSQQEKDKFEEQLTDSIITSILFDPEDDEATDDLNDFSVPFNSDDLYEIYFEDPEVFTTEVSSADSQEIMELEKFMGQEDEDNQADSGKKSSKFFKKKQQLQMEQEEEQEITEEEEEEAEERPKFTKTAGKKSSGFTKKNRFEFCSTTQVPEVEGVRSFELEKMEEYRRKDIERSFLQLLQSEQHISTAGTGSNAAKYLFLHGKNESTPFVPRQGKTLNIEFTSVIGTRAKNYEKFIKNSPFRYALPEDLYEELLLTQLKRYNRHEFKCVVAHLVHYCDSLNDHIIQALCTICERERIGYTFVEIAQLIKANDIRITPQGLQSITDLWQRFDVINEDMLPFLREYTRKMQIPLSTDFYAAFCRSLIRTKKFEKLQVIANAILQQIRPRPFKLDSSMGNLKGDQVAVLEKEWKTREQEKYLRLYIQLIEVIVKNLDTIVPAYLADLFDEYRRMRPVFNEKELGYAFVCYSLKRDKVEELLLRLDNQPEKGTSFMYDCLLQTLLSNFDALEDLSEKMLDSSILKNRVVLTNPQIMRSLIVFKKSSSSNSFSKFLDHSLRFQETINQSHEIKREMFYILNNNVEDVSVGGIFNLLDFIFNEKRQKERIEYRAVKLSEEEKAKKLVEIQQSTTKVAPAKKEAEKASAKKDGKKKAKQVEKQEEVAKEKEIEKDQEIHEGEKKQAKQKEAEGEKELSKKEEKKKLKKEKASERERQNELLDQVMAEQQSKTIPQTAQMRGNSDEEFISMIKAQTLKHESKKRKGLQSMSTLFEGSMQLSKEEEVPKGKEEKKVDPKDGKEDKKKKGKK